MNTINNIQNKILEDIRKGAIKQKPKWRFLLITCMVVFGVISLFLVLLYLVSFVALFLREHMIFEALQFGPRTVFEIMHTLPILLLVLVITVFLLLHVLVRYFAFAYTRSLLLTFGAGLLMTFTLFAAVLVSDKNSMIGRLGERRPGFQEFNSHFRNKMPPVSIQGVIQSVENEQHSLLLKSGETVMFEVTPRTRMDRESYGSGDEVIVLAVRKEEKLIAIGVRIFDETMKNKMMQFEKRLLRP